MTRDTGEVADDICGLVRRRGLDHGQVETVIAILREVTAAIGKLDQKGQRLALGPGQDFKVTQKSGMMLAAVVLAITTTT